MKRLIKHAMKQENRRGSALIISLTLITLLLFLAMIYAFEAQASQRQAKSAADSTQARFAANGAVNNFLSLITVEMALKEKGVNSSLNPAVSFGSTGFSDFNGRFILVTQGGTDDTDIEDYLTEPYIILSDTDSVLVTANNLEDSARWIKQDDSMYLRDITDLTSTNPVWTTSYSNRKMGFVVIDYTGAMSPDYNANGVAARTTAPYDAGASVNEIDCEESMGNAIMVAIQGLTDSPTSLDELILYNTATFLSTTNQDSDNPVFIWNGR